MRINRFEDIEAWQFARELANSIYGATKRPEFSKDYELKSQIRSAAGSAMHNIAEGFDAGSNTEFARFLGYAQRSCTEVQSELYLALDQAYIGKTDFDLLYEKAAHTRSTIGAFIKYLKRS